MAARRWGVMCGVLAALGGAIALAGDGPPGEVRTVEPGRSFPRTEGKSERKTERKSLLGLMVEAMLRTDVSLKAPLSAADRVETAEEFEKFEIVEPEDPPADPYADPFDAESREQHEEYNDDSESPSSRELAGPSLRGLLEDRLRKAAKANEGGFDVIAYGNAPKTDDDEGKSAAVEDFGPRGRGRRKALLAKYGGTQDTERAVTDALLWLARHQNKSDGSWSLKEYSKQCKERACTGSGNVQADAGATAMALLPFLAAGKTHKSRSPYQKTVADGLNWLVRHQKPDGNLASGCTQMMYSQGLATIALCEAYGLTGDPSIGRAAQAGANFIMAAQHKGTGGWRYNPGDPGDTSVLGWQIAALRIAKMDGLSMDDEVMKRAGKWLDSCAKGDKASRYSYTPDSGPSPTMTAVGLLCRQYVGAKRDDPMMAEGRDYFLANLPSQNFPNIYYWYYATQVMHNMPGKDWDTWNRSMRKLLLGTQERDSTSCACGSWDPEKDMWGKHGGRVMMTSLCCLTLEVYYRYWPVFGLRRGSDPTPPPKPVSKSESKPQREPLLSVIFRAVTKAAGEAYLRTAQSEGGAVAKPKIADKATSAANDLAGGHKERTVTAALLWLARHQNTDGSWSLKQYTKQCRDESCTGLGNVEADAGATAMALLPFLAAGQTHKSKGSYQKTIANGLNWLIRHQKPDGNLASGHTQMMYSQGLATIALCETYGLTGDRNVGRAAQAAVNFIIAAQNKGTGGWRYNPGDSGDTSVLGWQIMALKSAAMAGLSTSGGYNAFEGGSKWLDSCAKGEKGSQYSYTPESGPSPTMTAVGLLARQYLGAKQDNPMMVEGRKYLMQNLPSPSSSNVYYWYYATQAMHNMPGHEWDQWNRTMRRLLVDSQRRDEDLCSNGSWDPEKDMWGKHGGRLMTTSLNCLTLEIYYRYLPLFKTDREAAKPVQKPPKAAPADAGPRVPDDPFSKPIRKLKRVDKSKWMPQSKPLLPIVFEALVKGMREAYPLTLPPGSKPVEPKKPAPDAQPPAGGVDVASTFENPERLMTGAMGWLARHQLDDGSWSLQGYTRRCKDKTCTGPGSVKADAGATAMALLAFLGADQTHARKCPYQRTAAKAVNWLIRNQKPDGNLAAGSQCMMYSHGLATIALCEAYGMTGERNIGIAAQAAVRFIERAQNEISGGWRYNPGDVGDTSVLGWQLTALRSAKLAKLQVSDEALRHAGDWLDSCAKGPFGSRYSYTPDAGPSLTMTAVGLLGRQHLGAYREHPTMVAGVKYLMGNLPEAKSTNVYCWWFATQVMHNMPQDDWNTWNRTLRRALIDTQNREKGTCANGSWDPDKDMWGKQGGRVMTTALSCLCLEVYYQYLPLFRPEVVPEKPKPNPDDEPRPSKPFEIGEPEDLPPPRLDIDLTLDLPQPGDGRARTERAVTGALLWLGRHQNRSHGSWSLTDYSMYCKDDTCAGVGNMDADAGATAMALLPFLAAGQTHRSRGPYQKTVADGLNWLIRHQKADGNFASGHNQMMYSHGLATIAMSEAHSLTGDQGPGRSAQAGINFILNAQNKTTGGWRYNPGDPGDTSVLGVQLTALRSAKLAGLRVDDAAMQRASKWLDSCAKGLAGSQYAYLPESNPSATMTAVGLLSRQHLGATIAGNHENPMFLEGRKYLQANGPDPKFPNIYYWHHATQVMHNMGGDEWEAWHRRVRKVLVNEQCRKVGACAIGSWDPEKDRWGKHGGRLMTTALSCLTLEIYYRYLPLYREDATGKEKPREAAGQSKDAPLRDGQDR